MLGHPEHRLLSVDGMLGLANPVGRISPQVHTGVDHTGDKRVCSEVDDPRGGTEVEIGEGAYGGDAGPSTTTPQPWAGASLSPSQRAPPLITVACTFGASLEDTIDSRSSCQFSRSASIMVAYGPVVGGGRLAAERGQQPTASSKTNALSGDHGGPKR